MLYNKIKELSALSIVIILINETEEYLFFGTSLSERISLVCMVRIHFVHFANDKLEW